MTRPDALDAVGELPLRRVIGRLIDFAGEVGATTLAENARREHDRIDAARLYVDIIGSPSALWRVMGELVGISSCSTLTVGTIERLGGGERRVDAVLVERALASTVVTQAPWRGSHVIALESLCGPDLTDALAELEALALDLGAGQVADAERQCVRQLRTLLQHHLGEHHRSLRGPGRTAHWRCHRLSIARVIAESLLAMRTRERDGERQRLVDWLRVERTKLLMSSKADATAMLGERLQTLDVEPYQFRWAASQLAQSIARKVLAPFVERAAAETQRAFSVAASRLLAELTTSLGDLADEIPFQVLRPVDGHRAASAVLATRLRPPSSSLVQITDRLGLSSRTRAEAAARDQLVRALEHDSYVVTQRLASDYDRSRMLLERRCCDIIDTTFESVRVADEFTRQLAPTIGMGSARHTVDGWMSTLATL